MPTVTKSYARRSNLTPLEPWQVAYLMSDGKRLNYSDFQPRWLNALPYWRLFDGQKPVYLNPEKARHPADLWRQFGGEYLAEFVRRHPGQRPLPWWTWDAPGAADPADQALDPARYQRAIKQAQRSAKWPPEKQAEFLKKHGVKP